MGIETIFSNNIRTNLFSKNSKIHPISVKAGSRTVVERIRAFYTKKGMKNIYMNEEYLELYGEFDPYEITCFLLEEGQKTTINVLLYNNEGRKKLKVFESILAELREELKDLISA